MIPARCLTPFDRFQLPSSEATPWLLQPHQGNMFRSWLRDTDSQNGDALLCIYYINFMYLTIHLKSLHWLPVKVRSTYKIACLCYHCHSSTAPSYVTDMLHKKPLHTRNTRSSSYTMPLLNRPTVRQHLVIVHFLLLPLLSGTLFQMMSSVPHHCHHLSLV